MTQNQRESTSHAGEVAAVPHGRLAQEVFECRRSSGSDQLLLLTVEEAGAELRICRTRVFGLIANGTLPSVRIGRSRRVRRRDLETYVDSLDVAS